MPKRPTKKNTKKKPIININRRRANPNNHSINIKIDNSRKTTGRGGGGNKDSKFKEPQLYTPQALFQPARTIYQNNPLQTPQENKTAELVDNQKLLIKNQEEHAKTLNESVGAFTNRLTELLTDDRNKRRDFVDNWTRQQEEQAKMNNNITNKLDDLHNTTHNKYAEISSSYNNLTENLNNVVDRINNMPTDLLTYIPNYEKQYLDLNNKLNLLAENKQYLMNDGTSNNLNTNEFKSNDKHSNIYENIGRQVIEITPNDKGVLVDANPKGIAEVVGTKSKLKETYDDAKKELTKKDYSAKELEYIRLYKEVNRAEIPPELIESKNNNIGALQIAINALKTKKVKLQNEAQSKFKNMAQKLYTNYPLVANKNKTLLNVMKDVKDYKQLEEELDDIVFEEKLRKYKTRAKEREKVDKIIKTQNKTIDKAEKELGMKPSKTRKV